MIQIGKASRGFLLGVVALCLPCAANAEENIAIMRVLNKITTRVSKIHAPIGVTVAFGALRFKTRACHQSAPEDPPESKVLLDIWEDFPDSETSELNSAASDAEEKKNLLFGGWMFASSPSSSALEHPVYDLWPLRCEDLKSEIGTEEPQASELESPKQKTG